MIENNNNDVIDNLKDVNNNNKNVIKYNINCIFYFIIYPTQEGNRPSISYIKSAGVYPHCSHNTMHSDNLNL